MKNIHSVLCLVCMVVMVSFTTPDQAFAQSNPTLLEYQNIINSMELWDPLPNGQMAIIDGCGMYDPNLTYQIFFLTKHTVWASGSNVTADSAKSQNFEKVIYVGWGDPRGGYTGHWGYIVSVDPRPQYYIVLVSKAQKIKPVFFLQWQEIEKEAYFNQCGKYLPK